MATTIHPTAIVAPGAEIGPGTTIGPYSIIGPSVRIDADSKIGPHVVIDGNTTLGKRTVIYQFASIGATPQDLKFKGEPSTLELGDDNIIREYVTMQPGTSGGGMVTRIGSRNLFMSSVHVAHDVIIGSGCIFANSAAIAGHVTIEDRVNVGGLSGIHQFVRLGNFAMVGAGSMVAKDIAPYCMAQGDRAGLVGINIVGMERGGIAAPEIAGVRETYKKLFLGSGTFQDRLRELQNSEGLQLHQRYFLSFIADTKRGIALPRSKQSEP
jgi:UDP-N-acetylglucosamine acyltransferase